ncbi:hypothetical protein LWI28_026268 [Acer negundo]|uniref:Uncharacterized protein n=1 Tax=Acer negundo TaxID=4023 RepID=A0AAD5P0E3_ACENE|nr:hypothetical protein LWI28_026268 [Acer negundo]
MVRGVAARQFWSNRLLMMAMKTSTGRQMCLSLDFVATCCWRGKCLQQEVKSFIYFLKRRKSEIKSPPSDRCHHHYWARVGEVCGPAGSVCHRRKTSLAGSTAASPCPAPSSSQLQRFPKSRRSDGERSCSTPVLVPVQSAPDDGDEDIDRKAKVFIVGFRRHLLLEGQMSPTRGRGFQRAGGLTVRGAATRLFRFRSNRLLMMDPRKSSFDALSMCIVPLRRDLEPWTWLPDVSKTVNPYGGGFHPYSLSMGIVPSRRDPEQWLRLPTASLNRAYRKSSFDALSMGIVPSRRDLKSWPRLLNGSAQREFSI